MPFVGVEIEHTRGRQEDDEETTSDASARLRLGSFGVGLATPVDIYQQADRSTKYGVLFIALTFLAFFIVETLYGVSVHPVQYLMAGGALCLFYLLLLSLSEHLPFTLSYAVAAGATTALVGTYGRTMLGARKPAASTAGLLAGLYACLYVVLQLEDYALLVGSLALFVILALSMFVTRRVDWYAGRRAQEV
jgi:inner membrane protein